MWKPLGGNLPDDVMALTAAGGTPERLYASTMGAGLLRSTDGGQTWLPVMDGMDNGSNGASGMSGLASGMALAANGKIGYAGIRGGLSKSTDGGTTWSRIPFPAANVAVIGFSPTQPASILFNFAPAMATAPEPRAWRIEAILDQARAEKPR